MKTVISDFLFLGGELRFWESIFHFWDDFWEIVKFGKDIFMIKKKYKGRCIKKSVGKAKEICRTYNDIQVTYLDILQGNEEITEIKCNIPLDGDEIGEYNTDFLCVKSNGDLMVRECVFRKLLTKPMTAKLLDMSRNYWIHHGVEDWGLVIDEEK